MSRVQLPIIVTLNKLLSVDDAELVEGESGIPALQAIEGASLDVWNNVTTLREPVYEGPNPEDPEIGVGLMLTNEQGRFEGWVERSSLRVEVTYEAYYYEENLDMAPAADESIDTAWIANEAVTTAKIDDLAVTTGKLANGSVNNTKLAVDSVRSTHIQDGAVDQDAIANNAVGSGEIIDGSVGSGEINAAIKDAAAGTASLRTLGTGATQAAVGSTAVLTSDSRLSDTRTPTDNSVSTAKIENDAVTADKLADSVGTDLSRAVTTNHIRDDAVTAAKLSDSDSDVTDTSRAVTTNHIRNGSVTEAKLGTGAVTTDKILDGTIVHGDVNSANIDSRTGQSAGVLTNRTQDNSTPSLRTLGRNAGQAAPGNDPRFTYLVPEAGAVITSHVADGAITSSKFRPTTGRVFLESTAVASGQSLSGTGTSVGQIGITVGKASLVIVNAVWSIAFSGGTGTAFYGKMMRDGTVMDHRVLMSTVSVATTFATLSAQFLIPLASAGTYSITQRAVCSGTSNLLATDTGFTYMLVDSA